MSITAYDLAPRAYPAEFAVDPKRPYWKGYEGILVELVDDFIQQTTPQITYYSAESRAKNPGPGQQLLSLRVGGSSRIIEDQVSPLNSGRSENSSPSPSNMHFQKQMRSQNTYFQDTHVFQKYI